MKTKILQNSEYIIHNLIPPSLKLKLPLEWKVVSLKELIVEHKAGIFKNQKFYGRGVNIVGVADLYYNSSIDGQIFRLVELNENEIKEYQLKNNDIVYSESSLVKEGIGKALCVTKKGEGTIFAWHTRRIRLNQNANSKYIYYILDFDPIRKSIINRSTTTALTGMPMNEYFKTKIPIPSLNEQQKIASILSNVDELIQKTEQIIEKKKILFRSISNSIFLGKLVINLKTNSNESALDLVNKIVQKRNLTANKNVQINIESKENIDLNIVNSLPKNWTITNIGSIAHVTKLAGFEYTKYIKLKDTGEIPAIRAQNVQMGTFVKSNIKYIQKDVSDFLVRSQTNGREILMVFIGAGCGNVCRAPKGRWHLGPNVAKIDLVDIDTDYVLFYLRSSIGLANTLSYMKNTAQPSLSMETIRKIKINLPPLNIQKKISYLLNSMETDILKIMEKKLKIKNLKKGLMQQLLTGKIRVKV